MHTLSILIHTKNSAQTVERTLKSVAHLGSEIIVVDMMSTDTTTQIAKKYTPHIYEYQDVGFVEPARNFALNKAHGDWIFILDADEEVSPGLKEYLMSLMTIDHADASIADCYYVPRKNIIFNHWMKTGWWPDYQLRLFKRSHVTWQDEIHSIPITTGTVAELPAEEEYVILHHNYQTVDQYLDRLNRYTRIESNQRLTTATPPKKLTAAELVRDFNDELLRRLFAEKGIEEGMHGVGLSYLQSMFQLVTVLKMWQEKKFPPTSGSQQAQKSIYQLRLFQRNLDYWIADYMVGKTTGLSQYCWRIRRKLKI